MNYFIERLMTFTYPLLLAFFLSSCNFLQSSNINSSTLNPGTSKALLTDACVLENFHILDNFTTDTFSSSPYVSGLPMSNPVIQSGQACINTGAGQKENAAFVGLPSACSNQYEISLKHHYSASLWGIHSSVSILVTEGFGGSNSHFIFAGFGEDGNSPVIQYGTFADPMHFEVSPYVLEDGHDYRMVYRKLGDQVNLYIYDQSAGDIEVAHVIATVTEAAYKFAGLYLNSGETPTPQLCADDFEIKGIARN